MSNQAKLTINFEGEVRGLTKPDDSAWRFGLWRVGRLPEDATDDERNNALTHFMSLCAVFGSDYAVTLARMDDDALLKELDRVPAASKGFHQYDILTKYVFFERPDWL